MKLTRSAVLYWLALAATGGSAQEEASPPEKWPSYPNSPKGPPYNDPPSFPKIPGNPQKPPQQPGSPQKPPQNPGNPQKPPQNPGNPQNPPYNPGQQPAAPKSKYSFEDDGRWMLYDLDTNQVLVTLKHLQTYDLNQLGVDPFGAGVALVYDNTGLWDELVSERGHKSTRGLPRPRGFGYKLGQRDLDPHGDGWQDISRGCVAGRGPYYQIVAIPATVGLEGPPPPVTDPPVSPPEGQEEETPALTLASQPAPKKRRWKKFSLNRMFKIKARQSGSHKCRLDYYRTKIQFTLVNSFRPSEIP